MVYIYNIKYTNINHICDINMPYHHISIPYYINITLIYDIYPTYVAQQSHQFLNYIPILGSKNHQTNPA